MCLTETLCQPAAARERQRACAPVMAAGSQPHFQLSLTGGLFRGLLLTGLPLTGPWAA